jgi:hypothetical protein
MEPPEVRVAGRSSPCPRELLLVGRIRSIRQDRYAGAQKSLDLKLSMVEDINRLVYPTLNEVE